jgi:four helix bundle protein
MKDFRDLRVWEKAHQLTLDIYKASTAFPKQELYGLTSQIRRCSASIAANIAEGCGKRGNGEFHRFLQIASGSASELDYHLLLGRDLKYIADAEYNRLLIHLTELRRMLTSLILKVDTERKQAKC